MTKCTFHKYGFSGVIERHDALCLLPINILNEKIYLVLWLWFMALSIITSLHLVFSSFVMAVPSLRLQLATMNRMDKVRSSNWAHIYIHFYNWVTHQDVL